MQFISVFLEIRKNADSLWKNADDSRTQEGHFIYFFGSPLGKV